MAKQTSHIAVIPARKGSKGIPGKNRFLFDFLADFLDEHGLFDRVVVSTDDERLRRQAERRGYESRDRPTRLAGDTICLKDVFVDLVEHVSCEPGDYLWLLFIPLVWRRAEHFRAAIQLVEERKPACLCSFIPARSHPFNVWHVDEKGRRVRKYIDNDFFNRQDYPPAWENYNYLSCIRVRDLARANSNLICEDTLPVLLSAKDAALLQEVDEPDDFRKWRQKHPGDFVRWRDRLPKDVARALNLTE